MADKLSSDLPDAMPAEFISPGSHSSVGYQSATEGLGDEIKMAFQASVAGYGLEIHRVALQDIRLPPEVYAAAVDACKAAYLPLQAKAEAIARKMKLQAEADVIGQVVLGLKEIAGNIPALAFQEFLSPIFMNMNRGKGLGAMGLGGGGAATPAIE